MPEYSGDLGLLLLGYVIIYLAILMFEKKEPITPREVPIVTEKVKSFVQCIGAKHDLVPVNYTVLVPPTVPIEGVVAIKGVATLDECTVCKYTGAWSKISLATQEEIAEVNLTAEEYSVFNDKAKTLILNKDNTDILPEDKTDEE